jgi:hypothetical protein
MRSLWFAAAAGFCFLGLAGCQHAQEDYAQSAADRWFRMVTSELTPKGKYEMMCKAYRQSVPVETFAQALARNAYLKDASGLQILESEGVPTGADFPARAVRGVLWTNTGSYDVQIYEGIENGRMCITGLSIGGTPMLPSPADGPAGAAPTSVEPAGVSAR